MEPLNERLGRLGRAIAEVDCPDQEAIAHARRRWLREGAPARGHRWWLLVLPAAALAAAIVILVGGRAGSRDEQPLSYQVAGTPGVRGQLIATASLPVPVRFSDGSRVDVGADTRVQITALGAHGGTLDLDDGQLEAAVTHDPKGAWRFETGPYTVRVKGTRFQTSWNAKLEQFTLHMHEGAVEVSGPLLPAPVVVTTGQSVLAVVRENRFEIRYGSTADVAPSVPPPSTAEVKPDPAPTPRPAAVASGTGAPVQPSRWRELLAARSYGPAIKAAEEHGFDAVLQDATRAELYALSDAARYAGRAVRARQALITVRARFAEHGNSAFLLGRIAAERGEVDDAVEWFERYLREEPAGTLVEAATGRLMELYQPRDVVRARRVAERYLANYPDGAHAAFARTLVAP